MDWIKVLVKHLIHEYNDLSAYEYQAWVKLMALTAHLEHIPDQKQMLSVARYQTIESLEKKLHNHSTDLSSILHKVLIDVSYVVHQRELSKIKTQRFRERNKPVTGYVTVTSPDREEKRREDNKKNIKHSAFVLPEWIKKETWEAYREMRKSKRAPLTDRAASLIIKELEKLKSQGQQPEDVLNQSIMKSYTGVFPITTGGNGNGQRPFSGRGTGTHEISTPKEWKGDDLPQISDEERKRNLDKIKAIYPFATDR